MLTSDFFANVDKVFHDWNYRHPRILYGLVRWLEPEVVVEIGTYRGYAASWIARAIQENNHGRLFCIDGFVCPPHPYGDFETHWNDNLTKLGVRDWVTLIKGKSHQVKWPDKIDMAFIDADHSYVGCCHDVNQALLKGARVLAVDNTHLTEGSRRWADEFRALAPSIGWDLIEVPFQEGFLVAMEKPKKGSPDPRNSEEMPPFGDLSNATSEYGLWLRKTIGAVAQCGHASGILRDRNAGAKAT